LSNLPLTLAVAAGHAGAMSQDCEAAPALLARRPPTADGPASGPQTILAPRRFSARTGAYAALLVVWLVWGSTYVALRVGDESMPPLAMAAVRYLLAGAILYPVARRYASDAAGRDGGGPDGGGRTAAGRPGLRQWLGAAVVGTMLLAFGNGAVTFAEKTIPAGLAALLVASVPVWMVLADRVLNRRRLPALGWIAVLAGLAGIAILAQPHGHGAVLPVLITLGGALSWGTGSVLAGRLPMPAQPLLSAAMEMLAGGAVLALLAAVTGELGAFHPAAISIRSLLALLYLIGPGSLLAMTCYVLALRRLPTATVSTYAYVNPVIAVGLGVLLLGEQLTGPDLIGGAIVVACVAVLLISRSRQPGKGTSPAGTA
jgi:drug/metabolite transporter (DMT)-like permease